MRALPIGVPKVLVSSVASGDVAPYVGPADITMMYSVTDVQGLNSISRQVLGNAANALVGMVKARLAASANARSRRAPAGRRPDDVRRDDAVRCSRSSPRCDDDFECLVFHATGVGGRSMEKLVDSGLIAGVIDLTTTEVADMLMGGVLPATRTASARSSRTRIPYVGSVGALDMVNFGAAGDACPSATAGASCMSTIRR